MKSNYEERKANQSNAFERLADKNEQLSNSEYEKAKKIGSYIPMGQPILVGHHSEKRHRRDISKIDNAMRSSIAAQDKAAYYRDRAETLLSNTAISSDDPNALDKLQEKLERLQAQQDLYKAINAIVRKKIADVEKIERLKELGLKEESAAKLLIPDGWQGAGIPSYRMTNNNATIRNTRQRIEHLEKIAKIETAKVEINGVILKVSAEDNRVQMFFPDKPEEAVRKECKSHGFHYSPSLNCWQRQISNNAIYYAKQILHGLKKV